jgi:hypothetical protein
MAVPTITANAPAAIAARASSGVQMRPSAITGTLTARRSAAMNSGSEVLYCSVYAVYPRIVESTKSAPAAAALTASSTVAMSASTGTHN